MIQAAEFDPEPLTVARLRVRDVYGAERLVSAILELMASEKWFDRRAGDEYVLTAAGRQVLAQIFERRHGCLKAVELKLEGDIAAADGTLGALVAASLESPDPPGAWCLEHSRRRAPGPDAPALARIFQYLEDFNAFRDDAHMAAWRRLNVSGVEWETFSHVWRGMATTAGACFEQLHYRGYTRAEFAEVLEGLSGRGWVERVGDEEYCVTAEGRAVREEAERKTDEYFFAPWSRLDALALRALHGQLQRLQDGLTRWSEKS
jgi:hypothetical protein